MLTVSTARRAAKNLFTLLLLFSTILISISANTTHPVQASDLEVSPGKSDLTLGNSTSLVKLTYPNSSILTDSVGDLLFTVIFEGNASGNPSCNAANLTLGNCQFSLDLYIPPEFSGLSIEKIWTSFTNDYDPNIIRLFRQSSTDEIGPNWWKITLFGLNFTSNPMNPKLLNPANRVFLAYPEISTCTSSCVYVTKPQYIRLFEVTSPTIAGRYFFKAFVNQQSIGNSNFPTLVVKASRDPATISGTLRDLGDRNPIRAGQPIFLLPNTGAQIIAAGYDPLGQPVSAQAFINSTAHGSYTIFGVAPGTYNLTVYAAGYIPITITQFPYPYPFLPSIIKPTPITVAAAQSLEGVDVYLTESPIVTGTVLSETADGSSIPWGYVCSAFFTDTSGPPCPPDLAAQRAINVDLISLDGTTVIASNQPPYNFSRTTSPTATYYNFTIQNELSSWNGEIPQDNANFTSGLPTGDDYFLRAYVTSYVQLDEMRVHVANETLDTEAPIPLIRTGVFNVKVHFKNSNSTGSTLIDYPITVDGSLTVYAYDMQGILRAQNTTEVFDGNRTATVELVGFSNERQRVTSANLFQQNYGILPGTYYIEARFTAAPPVAGNAATTTNAPVPGSLVVGDLYYQESDILATIGLGEAIVELSFPMYRAGGIQLSIYSVDTQVPPVYYNWRFPGKTVLLTLISSWESTVYETNTTQRFENSSIPLLNVTGLQSGSYDLLVQTLGYTQVNIVHFTVELGANADASVMMIENPIISLTVAFRDEGLLTAINSTEPYVQPINDLDATPVRVEVFDYLGNFVSANASYIPNTSLRGVPTRTDDFILAGFDIYYGDPRAVWSGFYDTTDSVNQQAGGLLLYPWELSQPFHEFTVRIWVDGYYQLEPLRLIVPTRGNVSATVFVDRASRISGTVAGPDFFDRARPLSWATVDLEPYNYTLSGIIDVQPGNYTTSSLDGSFQVWAPQGLYGMGVSLEGYQSYSAQLAVPSGSDIFTWIWLDNYQPSQQSTSTFSSISTNSTLVVKQHVNQVPNYLVYAS